MALLDFADEQTREEWTRNKGMSVFQLFSESHIDTNVDLFVTAPFDFDTQWKRAKWLPVAGDLQAPVLAMDELLLMKSRAGRPKDQIDVAALRKMHGL